MPPAQEHGDVNVVCICCKHGKPCHLASQKVPESVQAGAEVPKSPDFVGGPKKQHHQPEKNSSFTDLKAAAPRANNDSSKTYYENIPPRLPNEYENSCDGGGSAISSETEMTDDNESDAATADRPPSTEFNRYRVEENQLYEDINRPTGFHRCGYYAARKNVKKPAESAPQKEVGWINSREKLSCEGAPMVSCWGGSSVPVSTANVKEVEEAPAKSHEHVNPKERLTEFYAGPCTPREAERQCKAANMFRLYHRIVIANEDQLQSVLPLFIVYKNLNGKYCHVRIKRCGKDLIKIDIEEEPKFRSLSQLITFYDIYAKLEDNMEPFPRKGLNSEETSK